MTRTTILLLIFGVLTHIVVAPPPTPNRQNGPCIGMDCLHGVLMHRDSKQGDNHQGEDTFERLESADRLRASAGQIGPCRGEDCMERIQHGGADPEAEHKAAQKAPGVDKLEQQGPCRGMDCMHGVLMHGDKEQGIDHKKKDAKDRKVRNEVHRGQVPKVDPDAALHVDKVDHTKKAVTQNSRKYKDKAPKMDPESILHGAEIDHKETKSPTKEPVQHLKREVEVGNLEAMLHGGQKVDHTAPRAERVEQADHAPDTVGDLESLLHGSAWEHDLHNKPRKEKEPRPEAESKRETVGVLDPHAMIHGKRAVLGRVPKEDEDDFEAWQKEKVAGQGFTLAYITDTIVNELDMFRQRYIPRFWLEHHEDDVQDDGVEGDKAMEKRRVHKTKTEI